jgi:protein gp37
MVTVAKDAGAITRRSENGPFHSFVHIVNGHPAWTGKVELIEEKLTEPLRWRKPCKVFVNSMSDLFHEALPDEAIDHMFAVMALCPHLTFQVLTKRPKRMMEYLSSDERNMASMMAEDALLQELTGGETMGRRWPLPNVWLGVSVENQETAYERIPLLLQTPAAVRFVSYEPALGPVDFSNFMCDCRISGMCNGRHAGNFPLPRLDQIIVGGESGPGARPFDVAWARSTIEQCKAAEVAVFCKQLGSSPYVTSGAAVDAIAADSRVWPHSKQFPDGEGRIWTRLRDRKGGDMSEWPADLSVREFPK